MPKLDKLAATRCKQLTLLTLRPVGTTSIRATSSLRKPALPKPQINVTGVL
jgi:hypothetical protein